MTEPRTKAGRAFIENGSRPKPDDEHWSMHYPKSDIITDILAIEAEAFAAGRAAALGEVREGVAAEPTLAWPGEIDDILDALAAHPAEAEEGSDD